MEEQQRTDSSGSRPAHNASEAPGNTQKTNPTSELGDADAVVEQAEGDESDE